MRSAAVALALLAALTGCSSNSSSDSPDPASPGPPPSVPAPPPSPPPAPPPASSNRAPSAAAGADVVVNAGQAATLDASASTDPDGDSLSYSWSLVAGTGGGGFAQPDQARTDFTAAIPGTYIVELTVRDAGNLTASDVLVIDVRMPRSTTGLTLERVDANVMEGGAATMAVYLPQPAGAAGVDVTLASSDPAVLEAPARISIPAGETMGAFLLEAHAAGSASVTATAPGADSDAESLNVQASLLDIRAALGGDGLVAGQSTTITVQLRNPAPAGGLRVAFETSAARGTLSANHLDIAAGAAEGSLTFTGSQPGGLRLTASVGGVIAGAPLPLMITPAVADSSRSSAELIDTALRAGTLTQEQATLYALFASFGAPELPAQYRGNDIGRLDSGSGKLAALRLQSLSAAGQEAIGKYLFPPVYTASWGAGITPAQFKSQPAQTKLGPGGGARANAVEVSCFDNLRGMPRSTTLPHWRFIRTGAFKVWYPTVLAPDVADWHWYTAEENAAAAARVAAVIQADFAALSAVLGEVMRDGSVTCNGGDDAIDVYVTRIGFGEKAQVMPYLPGACARPGWMWIAPDAIGDARITRNLIAHELVHLFQLRYARPDCGDWRNNILDEATASWAFDFLHPGDQFEHQFLTGMPSYFNPQAGEWRATPIETGAGSVRNCNGYCDYVFFEWLSRQYSPNAIRSVLDATQSVNAQQAYDTGLSGIGGGIQQLWPRFALFQWNDWRNHQYDQLNNWERVPTASISQGVVPALDLALEANLNGQEERDLSDPLYFKISTTLDGGLPALTARYVHIKFSDQTVSRVRLEHKGSSIQARWPRFKLQALQKINGQWQAAEDWSGETEKVYCRDRRAERVEELVLVYSNSHAGTEPFVREGPTFVEVLDEPLQPEFKISNGACMPWRGTTSVTYFPTTGGSIRNDATVIFKLAVPPGESEEDVRNNPVQIFNVESGTVSVASDYTNIIGCRFTQGPASGPIGELDARVVIDFQRRIAGGGGISTIPGVTSVLTCPNQPPMTVVAPVGAQWMQLGLNGQFLGDDGRTLRGSYTETDAIGQRVVSEWNLTAEREE